MVRRVKGQGAELGDGVVLHGSSVVGSGCKVGAGSILYLGYNPWQEQLAPSDGSLGSTLLSTSPKWLAALVLIGLAPSIWKRSERLPAWRIG